MREFAIGRVLSVAAAGEPRVHPSVRWGGSPGRRSHSKTTQWALGWIPTVRIGAGAWPICQAQEKAATPVGKPHPTVPWNKHLPVEEKGKSKSREKTLLSKRISGGLGPHQERGRKVVGRKRISGGLGPHQERGRKVVGHAAVARDSAPSLRSARRASQTKKTWRTY